MQREAATITVHDKVLDVQLAIGGIEAAARAAHHDLRRALLHHREREAGVDPAAVHQHRAGAALAVVAALLGAGQSAVLAQQVQQFEGLVASRQVERGIAHHERIEAQAPPEQGADRGVQHHERRPEMDRTHRAAGLRRRHAVGIALARHGEADVVQRQRPGRRTLGTRPGERGVRRQARDDLPQQQIASADGVQQPAQCQHGQHEHADAEEGAAQCEHAQSRTAPRAQLGDARLVRVAHSCAPMLR